MPVIPGFLDFTHVQNTGAAFGLLNAADFPYKPVVMIGIAALALVAIAAYATQLGFHERLARFGLALILGGAFGNLIDRAVAGYVVDFVDVYWGDAHFWAFNVADAAITDRGRPRAARHDRPRTAACIPSCLRSAASRSTPTASCWPPPTCSACSSRWSGRARAASIANRVMDLGIWIIISALVGAKLLLLIVDFDKFTDEPRGTSWTCVRSAGVFYGGLIAAVVVAFWYLWRHRMPMWTVTDVFAPGIALGHVIGRLGCLFAGCCFGRPTDVPVGDHVPQRVRGARTSARRSACRSIRRSSTRRAPSC